MVIQPGEESEHQPTVGGRGVNRRAFAGEDLQPHLPLGEIADQIDEMAQVAVEPDARRFRAMEAASADGTAELSMIDKEALWSAVKTIVRE